MVSLLSGAYVLSEETPVLEALTEHTEDAADWVVTALLSANEVSKALKSHTKSLSSVNVLGYASEKLSLVLSVENSINARGIEVESSSKILNG